MHYQMVIRWKDRRKPYAAKFAGNFAIFSGSVRGLIGLTQQLIKAACQTLNLCTAGELKSLRIRSGDGPEKTSLLTKLVFEQDGVCVQ